MRGLSRLRVHGGLAIVKTHRHPLKHVLMRQKSTAATPTLLSSPKQSRLLTSDRFYSKMPDSSDDNASSLEDSSRRPSTVDDVNVMTILLQDIIALKEVASRSWLGDDKVKSLCVMYKQLEKMHKQAFILALAEDYGVDGTRVEEASRNVLDCTGHNPLSLAKQHNNLRHALLPQYSLFFKRVGRLENGVKFLVDLRSDILECLKETPANSTAVSALQQINATLRDLLAMWFSVGFLKLERITWRSSCEILQKISEYEAVHPVRSWADIKRRVGPYRRCFVFVHSSMENEPLVVLHTALCDTIPDSLASIVGSRSRMTGELPKKFIDPEDAGNVRAGIFYSITSTQRGLQGIDLGNYLIKRVVRQLQAEFPYMDQFATLSPIPNFRPWLLEKIKSAERGKLEIMTPDEIGVIRSHMNGDDFWLELRRVIKNNGWMDSPILSAALRAPLLRLCAKYLYQEKRRNLAFCSVANFHLSNGAVLWRINWKADTSVRGLNNSCGLMVNYRYFLEDTERNSELYLGQYVVKASEDVRCLSQAADSLSVLSKL